MRESISPKQMARAIGVSEASVKRWCDKGVISTLRTPGGHRRLAMNEVLQFVRREGYRLVRSEVLGLPSVTGKHEITHERLATSLEEALVLGDEESVEQLVMNAYLSGISAIDICDRSLAKAFIEVGNKWHEGVLAIYQERRACEVVNRVLDHLRRALPSVQEDSFLAIGGSVSGDYYEVPTRMVEVALTELGWRAETMGNDIPLGDWGRAIEERKPRLVWLSVSHLESEGSFLNEYKTFFSAAESFGTIVVLGGRGLHSELRQEMKYSVYCDTLDHLSTFIAALPDTA